MTLKVLKKSPEGGRASWAGTLRLKGSYMGSRRDLEGDFFEELKVFFFFKGLFLFRRRSRELKV